MSSTDDSFVRLQKATESAQKAKASRDAGTLRAALQEIQALLDERFGAEGGFDGIVAIQAVVMAVQLPDLDLARQLAECMLRDVTRRLSSLNETYTQSALRKEHQESGIILNEAYACARAFVPRVLSPPITWILKAFAAQQKRAGPAVVWVLQEIRPILGKASWEQWPYDEDVAAAVDRAAAQTLIHTGNAIMQSAKGGLEGMLVEQALHCGLNAQALLPPDARDQVMADCKNLLGQVFQALGTAEQEDALQCFEECIAIENSLPNLSLAARDHNNAGAVALQLSQFYSVNGDEDQTKARRDGADLHLHAACAYFRDHGPKEDLRDSLVNLGGFYAYIRRPECGVKVLEEALGLMDSFTGDEKYYGIKILGNLGALRCELRQSEQALAYFDRAICLLETLSDLAIESDSYVMCYGGKGKLLCQMGRHGDAEPFLAKARERLETMRSSFSSEITNMQLLKVFHWIYEWSIVCLAALAQADPERWAEAFGLAENVKWRSFTALLRYLPLGMVDASQEPLVQEEEALLLQLQSALGSPVEAALLRDGRAEGRLNEIWHALEARFPDYVALRRQRTLSTRETAGLLDEEVPVLVEYYLGEESDLALALVAGNDGVASGAVLPATKTQIVELVRKLREQTDDKPVEAFNALSGELYRVLIEPIAGHFVTGAGICFVPYGEMHNLPFATLFGNGFYLAEKHAVVIVPTASALRWWVRKDRRGFDKCLVFTATTGGRVGEKQLPDLLLFHSLAKTGIAPLFASHQLVESPPATKHLLLEQLQTAWDVVHIACHGIARANALESVLALPGEGSSADRDVTAAEIATQVRCQTTLVTLSACDSAVAQASTGDDVAGLAHAFLLAGSSSVLASNAYVVQDLGVAITSAFYRYWKGEGPDHQAHGKLEALRLAQIDAMKRRNWFGLGARTWHPQQWGVFQLYGSWQ